MQVGFVVTVAHAAIEWRLYEPSVANARPLVSWAHDGDDIAALIGRLYYRDAWPADLVPGFAKDNDAAFALALYRRCGRQALTRLEGEFALVIWDAQAARLIALRDPLGGYPLFWRQHGEIFIIGTMMRRLLDRSPPPVLNMEFLADFLTAPVQRFEGADETSVYQGVQRIPPGVILTWEAVTRRCDRRIYWDWLAQLRQPDGDCLADVADRYRQTLQAAVKERLQGLTLSHLSGGMDSTSVALLARELIAAGAGEAPLHTVSLVYQRLPGLARELPYLEAALADKTDIVAHRVEGDELLDFEFATAPPHNEPYAALYRLALDRAPVQIAAAVGAATVLTGIGADDLLDMLPYHLADDLRQGRLRSSWRAASQWAQAYNCSVWEILYPFGVAPLAPAWVRRLQAFVGGRGLWRQQDWAIPSWFSPAFVSCYRLQERAIDNVHRFHHRCPRMALSVSVSALSHLAGDVIRWTVAAPLGIHVAHPFLDPRVVCLGLGIRAKLRPPAGQRKPVLAAAMQGRLPEVIRQRRRKGHFNEVYYLGLARHRPALEAMVEAAPPVVTEIFERQALLQALQEASLAGVDARSLQRLDFSLALIYWLSRQDEWLRLQEQPTVAFTKQRGYRGDDWMQRC